MRLPREIFRSFTLKLNWSYGNRPNWILQPTLSACKVRHNGSRGNWCTADRSTPWCRAGTRGSVRGRIEEFVEVSTRRLVLAALKHKIAGEFVEGCEQSRAAIGCLGDEHDRIAEALHIDAITSDATLLSKRHKHLCICDNLPKFARILQQ